MILKWTLIRHHRWSIDEVSDGFHDLSKAGDGQCERLPLGTADANVLAILFDIDGAEEIPLLLPQKMIQIVITELDIFREMVRKY